MNISKNYFLVMSNAVACAKANLTTGTLPSLNFDPFFLTSGKCHINIRQMPYQHQQVHDHP
jgi:hypothetical protein